MLSSVSIRPLLAFFVITAFIGIAVVVYRNGSGSRPPVDSALQQIPQNIDIALNKARFSEMRDGSVVWELTADHVEYDKGGEVAHLDGIRMFFERNRDSGSVTVTAEHGDYFSNSNNINLKGKVHVVTESGIAFDTDSIDYKASESRFRTKDKVTFRQHRLNLAATGMDLDVKGQQAHFPKAVDATVSATAITSSVPALPAKSAKKAAVTVKKQTVKKVNKRLAPKAKKRSKGTKK